MAKYQKIKLYLMIILSGIFFGATLLLSYITHSLVLLLDSYHMLHNVFALIVSLVALRVSKERTLKNTFGWARIEVLGLLVNSLFLATLCFSILVEGVQTMIHADHSDAMHKPLIVLALGIIEFLLNLLCIFLIGGYNHNNKCFLNYRDRDLLLSVVIKNQKSINNQEALLKEDISSSTTYEKANDSNTNDNDMKQQQSLIATVEYKPIPDNLREDSCQTTIAKPDSLKENIFFTSQELFILTIIKDFSGCILVMACSLIVYFTKDDVALFADPIISILSVAILMFSSYPLLKETGFILLQTVPQNIDIESVKVKLLKQFPEILNIHDFHVWCLTGNINIATAHIICSSHDSYRKIARKIDRFFEEEGYNSITIQPEFQKCISSFVQSTDCMLECSSNKCSSHTCCGTSIQRRKISKFKYAPDSPSYQEDSLYLEADLSLSCLGDKSQDGSQKNIDISTIIMKV